VNESTARALHRAEHDTEPDWATPGRRPGRELYRIVRYRARQAEAARVGRLDAIVAANIADRLERAKLIAEHGQPSRPVDVVLNELIRRELFSRDR